MTQRVFKTGDIVKLRSGGPEMTVTSVEGDDIVCTWFDENGVNQDGIFKSSILTGTSKGLGPDPYHNIDPQA